MKLLKHYQLKSDLVKDTVLEKLNEVTQTWHKEDNQSQLFEGRINGDKFTLYPTYTLAPRDQFRPKIEMSLKQKENYTQVNLNFSLPKLIKRFIPAAFIICLIAQLVLFYFFFWTSFKIPKFFMFVPVIFTLFVYYQTKILFSVRTKRALEHLTTLLNLEFEN